MVNETRVFEKSEEAENRQLSPPFPPRVVSRYSLAEICSSPDLDDRISLERSVVEFPMVIIACFPVALRSPTFKVVCRQAQKMAHTNNKYTTAHHLVSHLLACFLFYTFFFQIQRCRSPCREMVGLLAEAIEQGLILSECSRPSRQGPPCIKGRGGAVICMQMNTSTVSLVKIDRVTIITISPALLPGALHL